MISTTREKMYDILRAVECYRGPNRYDAEVQCHWLKLQWVIKKNCTSREEAQAVAQAQVNILNDRIEELVLTNMKDFKMAEE